MGHGSAAVAITIRLPISKPCPIVQLPTHRHSAPVLPPGQFIRQYPQRVYQLRSRGVIERSTMSDIDDELLDLAGEGTDTDSKPRQRKSSSSGSKIRSQKYKSK